MHVYVFKTKDLRFVQKGHNFILVFRSLKEAENYKTKHCENAESYSYKDESFSYEEKEYDNIDKDIYNDLNNSDEEQFQKDLKNSTIVKINVAIALQILSETVRLDIDKLMDVNVEDDDTRYYPTNN